MQSLAAGRRKVPSILFWCAPASRLHGCVRRARPTNCRQGSPEIPTQPGSGRLLDRCASQARRNLLPERCPQSRLGVDPKIFPDEMAFARDRRRPYQCLRPKALPHRLTCATRRHRERRRNQSRRSGVISHFSHPAPESSKTWARGLRVLAMVRARSKFGLS